MAGSYYSMIGAEKEHLIEYSGGWFILQHDGAQKRAFNRVLRWLVHITA